MELKRLEATDLKVGFLDDFIRNEHVKRQWRQRGGEWVLEDIPCERVWSGEKKAWVVGYLTQCVEHGGAVTGAFDGDRIVGFSMVEGRLRGSTGKYANLAMLFVSNDLKRQGLGTLLFRAACEGARELGAQRLYISATPKEDTIAFYQKMGCRDASNIISEFNDSPDDRPMEFDLSKIRLLCY